jgi:hypothetical protein
MFLFCSFAVLSTRISPKAPLRFCEFKQNSTKQGMNLDDTLCEPSWRWQTSTL